MDLSSYALYPHQVTGVEFLTRRGRAILGDDMGLGKTRQAIIALRDTAPAGAFTLYWSPLSDRLRHSELRSGDSPI
jgi:SNF2 family DNA or RNA helicase